MKKTLKAQFIAVIILVFFGNAGFTQSKLPSLDQSVMDMSYYPPNYPILKIQDKITEPLVVRAIYSRPQKSGRTIFGQLVEYDKVWRMGANEATELEFFHDVNFGGKTVPKGRYTLCAIPTPGVWTVILNKETDTWGSFIYDQQKDLLRIDVPVDRTPEIVEYFTLFFEKSATGFNMLVEWENTMITLPISVIAKPVKAPPKTPVKTKKK